MSRPHLILRPYCDGDETRFVARPDFQREFEFLGEGKLPSGLKWSLWDDEACQILAVAGFSSLGGRYYGAWAYACDMAPRQWLEAAKLARDAVRRFTAFHSPERLYAVAADWPGADRLLERAGFVPHGNHEDRKLMTYWEAA